MVVGIYDTAEHRSTGLSKNNLAKLLKLALQIKGVDVQEHNCLCNYEGNLPDKAIIHPCRRYSCLNQIKKRIEENSQTSFLYIALNPKIQNSDLPTSTNVKILNMGDYERNDEIMEDFLKNCHP